MQNKIRRKHDELVEIIKKELSLKNFAVAIELELPRGKGAVDIFASREELNIYIEVKSSPQSIDSKKVKSQLRKYRDFFGKENIYCLISPDSRGNPVIRSLDKRINCSLRNYLSKI